ncbi:MAG: DUF368 domain-containing protein [Clostridia bacterium]|nr:DUF368 domain-containing protein [Clostridia bacterium]
MDLLRVFMKGLIIGGTLTVPGVSGGSMALVLGIYSQLIHSFNCIFKKGVEKREYIKFILIFSLGGGIGIFSISRVILKAMTLYPLLMTFLFAGAVVGGFPVILREFRGEIFRGSDVVYPLLGVAAVLWIASLPSNLISMGANDPLQWLIQCLCGVLAAAALVLPGISVSQVLYILGLYTILLKHLAELKLLSLIPFGIGMVFGILFISRLLEDLMARYHKESYLLTFGFVVGSVIQLFKEAPMGEVNFSCIFLFFCGFLPIFLISKKRTH